MSCQPQKAALDTALAAGGSRRCMDHSPARGHCQSHLKPRRTLSFSYLSSY